MLTRIPTSMICKFLCLLTVIIQFLETRNWPLESPLDHWLNWRHRWQKEKCATDLLASDHPDTMPSANRPWAFASSTMSQLQRATCRKRMQMCATELRSSIGMCIVSKQKFFKKCGSKTDSVSLLVDEFLNHVFCLCFEGVRQSP